MYVMIYFICMTLVELQGTQSKRELQNEKFLPTLDSNPQPSTYKAEAIIIVPHIWFDDIQLKVIYIVHTSTYIDKSWNNLA